MLNKIKLGETVLIMLFIGCSVAFHSLGLGCTTVIALLIKHILLDYYNYKHTDAKVIESDQLRMELQAIRDSHAALEKSTATVNTQLNSLQASLSMVGKGGSRYV